MTRKVRMSPLYQSGAGPRKFFQKDAVLMGLPVTIFEAAHDNGSPERSPHGNGNEVACQHRPGFASLVDSI